MQGDSFIVPQPTFMAERVGYKLKMPPYFVVLFVISWVSLAVTGQSSVPADLEKWTYTCESQTASCPTGYVVQATALYSARVDGCPTGALQIDDCYVESSTAVVNVQNMVCEDRRTCQIIPLSGYFTPCGISNVGLVVYQCKFVGFPLHPETTPAPTRPPTTPPAVSSAYCDVMNLTCPTGQLIEVKQLYYGAKTSECQQTTDECCSRQPTDCFQTAPDLILDVQRSVCTGVSQCLSISLTGYGVFCNGQTYITSYGHVEYECHPEPVTTSATTTPPTSKASTTKTLATKTPSTKPATTKTLATKTPSTKSATTKTLTTKTPSTKSATTKTLTTKTPSTKSATTKTLTAETPSTKSATTKTLTAETPSTKSATTKTLTTKTPSTKPATRKTLATKTPSTKPATTKTLATKTSSTKPATTKTLATKTSSTKAATTKTQTQTSRAPTTMPTAPRTSKSSEPIMSALNETRLIPDSTHLVMSLIHGGSPLGLMATILLKLGG